MFQVGRVAHQRPQNDSHILIHTHRHIHTTANSSYTISAQSHTKTPTILNDLFYLGIKRIGHSRIGVAYSYLFHPKGCPVDQSVVRVLYSREMLLG